MERIDELTEPPVVGRVYWVPCVLGWWRDTKKWWPVMGRMHEDVKFFNFALRHYHLDRRFVGDNQVEPAVRLPLCDRSGKGDDGIISAVEYRRRVCVRADMSFPVWPSPVGKMQRHYAGRACKRTDRGLICPHQGFALGSIAPDENGVRQCPMHGLRIEADGVVSGRVA